MNSRFKRNKKTKKNINPIYWVFCEGQTESNYIKFLRQQYRYSMKIITHESGMEISEKYIKNHIKKKKIDYNPDIDKIFLFYDLDRDDIRKELGKIRNVILLVSNPCIELWFLLHYEKHNKRCTSSQCINSLKSYHKSYQKGKLDETLKNELINKIDFAINNAKLLNHDKNPSTTVYLLVEELNK